MTKTTQSNTPTDNMKKVVTLESAPDNTPRRDPNARQLSNPFRGSRGRHFGRSR